MGSRHKWDWIYFIRREAAERGLTMAEAKKAFGISPQVFQNWRAGKSNPSLGTIRTISENIGCPAWVVVKAVEHGCIVSHVFGGVGGDSGAKEVDNG